jgi:large subunit ribosomal protein L23
MKDIRDIIIQPVVSEKSYALNEDGKYAFYVDTKSNKTEIKHAIEKIFDVQVLKVNTINKIGKIKRTRFGVGKEKNRKKAIITLKTGTIDVFSGASPDLSGAGNKQAGAEK